MTYLIAGIAAFFLCFAARVDAAPDSRLPDGADFVFWEKPQAFTRTYYVDGSAPRGNDQGPGTLKRPFRTIGRAAEILQPGERVVIAAGTYRELVRPARGGTAADKMISYESAPGAVVVVKGSEVLRDWQPNTEPGTWKHEFSGVLFPDAYNPFAMANVPGDWSWLNTKLVDMGPYFRRRGMIFVDGKPLEPVEQYRELGSELLPGVPQLSSEPPPRRGTPPRTRRGPIMQEIGGSPEGRFWVEHQGTALHIRVPGDPNAAMVEATTREQAFAPRQSGLGYIRIKGLTFQHAGNAFPPPQRGLVSTAGGHHWIIEGNTIEWATGVGLDIGSQHWTGGARNTQAGEAHIVRGNTFRYLGVEGIGGMGTLNTLVEDNLIEWVGWQDAERAWEAAGAKFHRARGLLFRRNVVRHIRHANAVWLDVGNVNSRITANVFADVLTVSAAIHMEMSLAPNQIDNNIIWDVRNSEPGTPGQRGAAGSGVFLHASQNQILAQNLIGRCDNAGVWPALRPDRAGSGNAREHKIYNNIFAHCDKGGIVFQNEHNAADGNFYASLPERFAGLADGDTMNWLDLSAWRAQGWDRQGGMAALELSLDPDRLELKMEIQGALGKVPVYNAIDSDLTGQTTGALRLPGPLAEPGTTSVHNVDPRATRAQPAQ